MQLAQSPRAQTERGRKMNDEEVDVKAAAESLTVEQPEPQRPGGPAVEHLVRENLVSTAPPTLDWSEAANIVAPGIRERPRRRCETLSSRWGKGARVTDRQLTRHKHPAPRF